MPWRAAVIGCGAAARHGDEGFAIGRAHGRAYRELPDVTLAAACDVDADNLRRFLEGFDVPHGYRDVREMLAAQRPDIVSVCVPVGHHASIVEACAAAGVRAILCEKPLALGLGEAEGMLRACAAAGTCLALNTQRRFAPRWRAARTLLEGGAVGRLLRFEGSCPGWDLMEWGTHWVDMARFFAGDVPAEWVVAQVDARTGRRRYGHLVEDDALVEIGFRGGATALLFMGEHAPREPANRIVGSDGLMELDGSGRGRFLGSRGQGWHPVPDTEGDAPDAILLSIRELLAAVAAGREPAHGPRGAWAVTEMVMAAYESATRGQVVELPLAVRDFPLERVAAQQRTGGGRGTPER